MAEPVAATRPALTISKIRFLLDAPPGAKVRREFKQPRHVFAVEEALENLPDLVTADACSLVFIPRGSEGLQKAQAWLGPTSVLIEQEDVMIQWSSGRVVAQGRPERREDVLAALTDFAFFEGELRAMEAALEGRETQAQADVALAYRIRHRDRKHWDRFTQTAEYFSRMRLAFARLEPQLEKGSRTLSPDARRLMTRLVKKADVWDRLQAVSDRLEAMEDLYEGASDRVADYRWYRNGHLLEFSIIAFLLLECVIMVYDIHQQNIERQEMKAAEERVSNEDLSEEFKARIVRVSEGKVTFARNLVDKDAQKLMKGPEQSLPTAENLLVVRGKMDKDTREVEAGDPIEGGLMNPIFASLGEKGLRAILVTDSKNKKIAQIYVFTSGN